jgi:hypothetical protein
MDNKRIYNLNQIEGACVIGSPIIAGILIFLNYKNFGEKNKGIAWIFIGIIWTIALLGLTMLIPDNLLKSLRMAIPLLNGLILYPIIKRLQGDKIDEHFVNNGKKGSNWFVALLLLIFISIIVLIYMVIIRTSPISDYSRRSFGENGIYYNQNMPVAEVDKLGGILQRLDYFSPNGAAEAIFIAVDSIYEFRLITDKEYINDNQYLNAFQQLFKHVDRYDFQKPLTFKLIDPDIKHEKIVELSNYESIPLLVESERFEKNHRFMLYYELAIEKYELKKFQNLIHELDRIFIPQNEYDFIFDYENDTYILKLYVPMHSWTSEQVLTEFRFLKGRLNNYGFKYPFRLLLQDDSGENVEEFEIM